MATTTRLSGKNGGAVQVFCTGLQKNDGEHRLIQCKRPVADGVTPFGRKRGAAPEQANCAVGAIRALLYPSVMLYLHQLGMRVAVVFEQHSSGTLWILGAIDQFESICIAAQYLSHQVDKKKY